MYIYNLFRENCERYEHTYWHSFMYAVFIHLCYQYSSRYLYIYVCLPSTITHEIQCRYDGNSQKTIYINGVSVATGSGADYTGKDDHIKLMYQVYMRCGSTKCVGY